MGRYILITKHNNIDYTEKKEKIRYNNKSLINLAENFENDDTEKINEYFKFKNNYIVPNILNTCGVVGENSDPLPYIYWVEGKNTEIIFAAVGTIITQNNTD